MERNKKKLFLSIFATIPLMTLQEKNNLHYVRSAISNSYDFSDITDNDFYEIATQYSSIDLDDFDSLSLPEQEEELIAWLLEFQEKQQTRIRLETLFIYIEQQGYDLNSLLSTIDYNESNFDISTFTLDTLNYVETEIQYYVSELDYACEIEQLEEELAVLDNINLNTYSDNSNELQYPINNEATIKQIEALKQTITSLSKEQQQKKLKHNLAELEIVQNKDFLSTADLAILYPNFSTNRQVTYRGRIHDPLPFQQLKKGGKIIYDRKEVDIWKINNNK